MKIIKKVKNGIVALGIVAALISPFVLPPSIDSLINGPYRKTKIRMESRYWWDKYIIHNEEEGIWNKAPGWLVIKDYITKDRIVIYSPWTIRCPFGCTLVGSREEGFQYGKMIAPIRGGAAISGRNTSPELEKLYDKLFLLYEEDSIK